MLENETVANANATIEHRQQYTLYNSNLSEGLGRKQQNIKRLLVTDAALPTSTAPSASEKPTYISQEIEVDTLMQDDRMDARLGRN